MKKNKKMSDFKILKVDEIGSTNEELKRMAKEGLAQPGFVLIANRQVQGHGQYERIFESPKGGLYMSIYQKKELPFDPTGLTQKIGVIVKNILWDLCDLETNIKLPNDIIYMGKKLCGILVESFTYQNYLHIIIGIGLNLNTNIDDFSPELKDTADSVSHIIGKNTDPKLITDQILNKIKEV